MEANKNTIKDGLLGLQNSLASLGEMQKELLKQLPPEKIIAYSKFEQNYASLIKSGDMVGAKKLADKFNEENK